MASATSIATWLNRILFRVSYNGAAIDYRDVLNITDPFRATDDPSTTSIDVILNTETQLLFSQNAPPYNSDSSFDPTAVVNISALYSTILNPISLDFNEYVPTGTTITIIDTGLNTASNNVILSDSANYPIQNPTTKLLGITYTITTPKALTFRKMTDGVNFFWCYLGK